MGVHNRMVSYFVFCSSSWLTVILLEVCGWVCDSRCCSRAGPCCSNGSPTSENLKGCVCCLLWPLCRSLHDMVRPPFLSLICYWIPRLNPIPGERPPTWSLGFATPSTVVTPVLLRPMPHSTMHQPDRGCASPVPRPLLRSPSFRSLPMVQTEPTPSTAM
jgi:hypothetical protein